MTSSLLTSSQAAEMLGITSPETITNWLEGGYFPGAFQAGGHWVFPMDEVLAVIAEIHRLRQKNLAGDMMPEEETEDAE